VLHLPRDYNRPDRPLAEVLLGRRSARVFTAESVELADLSALLYYSVAVTSTNTDSNGITWGERCAPSGGSLYPVDIYCISQNVVGCNEGLYSYDPNLHALQILVPGSYVDRISSATFLGETVVKAGVVILMVANFPRTKFKYGERAYRFTLLEAGHIAQNMLLVAESLGLGALPVGGYIDDQFNAIIGVDGCEQAVVYAVIIGRLPKESIGQQT
jgi:SagB-type dehydrogenase family enzyme